MVLFEQMDGATTAICSLTHAKNDRHLAPEELDATAPANEIACVSAENIGCLIAPSSFKFLPIQQSGLRKLPNPVTFPLELRQLSLIGYETASITKLPLYRKKLPVGGT